MHDHLVETSHCFDKEEKSLLREYQDTLIGDILDLKSVIGIGRIYEENIKSG